MSFQESQLYVTDIVQVQILFNLRAFLQETFVYECSTVPASGKLTHSTDRLAAGLRLNAGSTTSRKPFVIEGIPDFCPALLFVNRLTRQ